MKLLKFLTYDRLLHFFASFSLQCVLANILMHFVHWPHFELIALVIIAAVTILWEFYNFVTKGTDPDRGDVYMNLAGAITYILFIHITQWNLIFFQ